MRVDEPRCIIDPVDRILMATVYVPCNGSVIVLSSSAPGQDAAVINDERGIWLAARVRGKPRMLLPRQSVDGTSW